MQHEKNKYEVLVCSEFHAFGSKQVQLRYLLSRDSEETLPLLLVVLFEHKVPYNPENSVI